MIPFTHCALSIRSEYDSQSDATRSARIIYSDEDQRLLVDFSPGGAPTLVREGDVSTSSAAVSKIQSLYTDTEDDYDDDKRSVSMVRYPLIGADGWSTVAPSRRLRRPVLKALSQDVDALIDPHYSSTIKGLLSRCGIWSFSTFALDICTHGQSLTTLLMHLCFVRYAKPLSVFKLDPLACHEFFGLVERGYHACNPYHNAVHAADVTQAIHCFLSETALKQHVTPLETLSCLIGAVVHDLDHPGVNQSFLAVTNNHLVALYDGISVLENHHWRCALSYIHQTQCLAPLDAQQWSEVILFMKDLILATDITRQQEFITKFKQFLSEGDHVLRDLDKRRFILQIALKCADLCNPCRPWDISYQWSVQVCHEFYRQGDYERRLGLPVSQMCNRRTAQMARIQVDFFRYVAAPLFELWHAYFRSKLSTELLAHLRINQRWWEKRLARATCVSLETNLNVPLASDEEDSLYSSDASLSSPSSPSPTSAPFGSVPLPPIQGTWGRRHSIPLVLPKLLPKTYIRRRGQSLPIAEEKKRLRFEAAVRAIRDTTTAISGATSGRTATSGSGETSGSRVLPLSTTTTAATAISTADSLSSSSPLLSPYREYHHSSDQNQPPQPDEKLLLSPSSQLLFPDADRFVSPAHPDKFKEHNFAVSGYLLHMPSGRRLSGTARVQVSTRRRGSLPVEVALFHATTAVAFTMAAAAVASAKRRSSIGDALPAANNNNNASAHAHVQMSPLAAAAATTTGAVAPSFSPSSGYQTGVVAPGRGALHAHSATFLNREWWRSAPIPVRSSCGSGIGGVGGGGKCGNNSSSTGSNNSTASIEQQFVSAQPAVVLPGGAMFLARRGSYPTYEPSSIPAGLGYDSDHMYGV